MAGKNIPSLPANTDRQLRATIEKLAEATDTGAGLRGRPEDRYIRVADLLNLGLAKKLGAGSQRLVSGENLVSDNAPNLTIPPQPENLEARGGIGIIFLVWNNARAQYANHSLTEIWRSETDDIGTAVMIGQTAIGFIHPDSDVDYTKTYYYWIRFVSVSGVTGPWNSGVGTAGRCQQDPGELLDLLSGEIRETQLHRSLLEPIQLIDAPGGLVDQITASAQGLIAEAEARAQQIQDESSARALALQQEALARGAAITAVENAQQTVNDSVASQLTTVTAATGANTAGLQNEITTRTNQVNSLSQQMSTLTAGTNSQFDHVNIWYFDEGIESWTGNGAPTIATNGWLRPANHASAPYVSPPALAVDGSKYTQVRLRIKKTGAPTWLGELRWITTTDPTYEATNKKLAVAEPAFDANGIANLTFAVSGTHWVGKTVSGLRLYLSDAQTATDYFELDWVAIGRPAPGASSAELSELQQTVTSNYSALSQSITNTNAALANKAETTAVNNLTSRVSDVEGTLVSQSSSLTSVRASLLNSSAIPSDFTNGLDDWTTTRHGAPTAVLSTTGTLVTDAELGRSLEINTFTGAGGNILTKGVVRVIPGRIYEVRARFKVVSSDGSVGFNLIAAMMPGDFSASLSPNFTAVQAITVTDSNVVELVAKFSTVAAAGIFALNSAAQFFRYGLRLNTNETGLVVRVGSITCTDITDVNALIGLSQANSTATSLLDARVVATEDAIVAQSTQATNLASSLFPNAIIPNPTFLAWPTGDVRPTGWAAFGTVVPSRHTGSYAYTGGNAVQFVTGTSNAGLDAKLSPAVSVDAPYVDVELAFTVTAGASLSGAGVLVQWHATDATSVQSVVALNNIFAPGTFSLNKKYTVNVRAKKPAAVGKTFSYNRVYLMANHSGSGLGALTSKTIIFDSILVLISDASADALQTLDTRVTAAEGTISSQSAAITTLQNNVAGKADASAVNALTTRVTTAEGAINSQASSITQLQASAPGSGNLFPTDTDFNTGSAWRVSANSTGQTVTTGVNYPGTGWVPMAMYQFGGSVPGVVSTSQFFDLYHDPFPCEPGKRYCFAVWVAQHRSTSRINMQFLNAAGTSVGTFSGDTLTGNNGGTNLNSWNRSSVFGVAPATAVRVQFFVRCTGTGENNPYLWLLRPMLSIVSSDVTVAPQYSPSGAPATMAAVKVTAEAAASTANGAVARWEVKTTVGQLTGGVGFWNDGIKTRFAIHADQFSVYSPGSSSFGLIVEGGKVVMDGAFIKNASITSASITDLSVTKLTGNTASFVAANIGSAIINDANIGTLTVDKIIQTNASEDISASSTVPTVLPSITGASNGAFGRAVLQIVLPTTTRNRKYVGTIKASLSVSTAGSYRVAVFAAVQNSGTFNPTASITDTTWSFPQFTQGGGITTVNWQKYTTTAAALSPANWSSLIEGRLVVFRLGSAIIGIGVVSSTSATYVAAPGTSPQQYQHIAQLSLSSMLVINNGIPDRLDIYTSAPYSFVGKFDSYLGFGANSPSDLISPMFDMPRGNAQKTMFIGVGIYAFGGTKTCEEVSVNYTGIR